uniref:COG complex component COG2 C-terminal domain-containing protein n=1 Tax=Glossina palpalis gambiensis TaxID=67801 RepID=A0A1B0B5N3_9MUSC
MTPTLPIITTAAAITIANQQSNPSNPEADFSGGCLNELKKKKEYARAKATTAAATSSAVSPSFLPNNNGKNATNLEKLNKVTLAAENSAASCDVPLNSEDYPRGQKLQVQLVLKNLPTQLQDQQQELNLLKETVEKSFNDIKETITKHSFTIEYVLVDTLINDYTDVVIDVLTSVQKTEESLRSLKNLKSGAGGSTIASAVSLSNSITSDDDKVRLQLRVDVLGWTGEISKLGFTTSDIEKLVDLNEKLNLSNFSIISLPIISFIL